MAKMGRYCKAYMLGQVSKFDNWIAQAENARLEEQETDEGKQQAPRELTEDSVIYLQENYIVTDGIYLDENVLFDDVTEDWKQFCSDTLGFEIPDYIAEIEKAAETTTIEHEPSDTSATEESEPTQQAAEKPKKKSKTSAKSKTKLKAAKKTADTNKTSN